MKRYRTVNILFLGGAKRVSLAERFLRSAKSLGVKLTIFSYELNTAVPISSVSRVILGLKWADAGIMSDLSKVVRDNNINIVLPFVDQATIIAARLKGKIEGLFVPCPDEPVCARFFDKLEANNWFEENGFTVPPDTKALPIIAKPRRGSAAHGIFIIRTPRERNFFFHCFRKDDYIIQKFIEGIEYSMDCYVSPSGKILTIVPRVRIEVASGEVIKSLTVKESSMIGIAQKIIEKGKFTGVVTIQLIKEKRSGRLFVLEINPRFGGGAILSIEAGADIPSMILKDYFGITSNPVYNWKDNLLMTRAYREFFHYADNH